MRVAAPLIASGLTSPAMHYIINTVFIKLRAKPESPEFKAVYDLALIAGFD